ncbi:hypothetical protein BYT27DRAFT_7249570 [Phlegmacium glaucopus]|nr:hypothetical protein BYT27DRAFT_7249570 [Phlegmacium glaucopus]
MTTRLETFIFSYPDVTLAHAGYGRHFHLGHANSIFSTPRQQFQSFIDIEGTPYRFIVVGQLSSFKVIEDLFGHYLLVNLRESDYHGHFSFGDTFCKQMDTLQKIEDKDKKMGGMSTQYAHWRTPSHEMILNVSSEYHLSNCSLSPSDIGSFMVAVVDLRCVDVSDRFLMFHRMYWIEAYTFHIFTTLDAFDEEYVQGIIKHLGPLQRTAMLTTSPTTSTIGGTIDCIEKEMLGNTVLDDSEILAYWTFLDGVPIHDEMKNARVDIIRAICNLKSGRRWARLSSRQKLYEFIVSLDINAQIAVRHAVQITLNVGCRPGHTDSTTTSGSQSNESMGTEGYLIDKEGNGASDDNSYLLKR